MSSSALPSSSRVAADQGASASLTRRVLAIVAASLVIAAASHAAFPLPFTPVPFTLQPLAILAVGLFLGPVDGTMAVLSYLAEGAAGLPVFSPTGPGGLLQLFGPTGGYLMADPLVAFLAGLGVRRLPSRLGSFWAAALSCTVAVCVLFTAGAFWLHRLHPVSAPVLWMEAIGPFLPGEAVKVLLAASLFRIFATQSSNQTAR